GENCLEEIRDVLALVQQRGLPGRIGPHAGSGGARPSAPQRDQRGRASANASSQVSPWPSMDRTVPPAPLPTLQLYRARRPRRIPRRGRNSMVALAPQRLAASARASSGAMSFIGLLSERTKHAPSRCVISAIGPLALTTLRAV